MTESAGWSRCHFERKALRKVRAPRAGCRLTAGEGDFKDSATERDNRIYPVQVER